MLIVFFIIHGISLVVCTLITYEFIHIHTKRTVLLNSIAKQDVRIIVRGRKRSVIIYSFCTIATIVYTTVQLFS